MSESEKPVQSAIPQLAAVPQASGKAMQAPAEGPPGAARDPAKAGARPDGTENSGDLFALLFAAQTQTVPPGQTPDPGPVAEDVLPPPGAEPGVESGETGGRKPLRPTETVVPGPSSPTQDTPETVPRAGVADLALLPGPEIADLPVAPAPDQPAPRLTPAETGRSLPAMAALAVPAMPGRAPADNAPEAERGRKQPRDTVAAPAGLPAGAPADDQAVPLVVQTAAAAPGQWPGLEQRRPPGRAAAGHEAVEPAIGGLPDLRPGGATAAPVHAPLAPEVTRHAAQAVSGQIAAAVQASPDGQIEIALDPVELGRVRIGMHAHDGTMALSIIAERPETADLMRRHLDQLIQDFRAIGYTDVTFTFGDQREAHRGRAAMQRDGGGEDMPQGRAAISGAPPPAGRPGRSGALDLRL